MTMPNFLVLGAAKSGTTSLHHYLRQHPEVYMCPIKDTFFFDFDGELPRYGGPGDNEWYRDRAVVRLKDYKSLFADVTSQKAVGEICAQYLYDPLAPARIRRYIPHAKLIAVLRTPVERGYSSFLQQVRDGYETADNYEAALRLEPERVAQDWRPIWHYKSRGFYSSQVKRYLEHFPASQIRIYLYDELQNDPVALVKDMCGFLGVDDGFCPDMTIRHNVAGVPRSRLLYRLVMTPNLPKTFLKPMIPTFLRRRLRAIVTESGVSLQRPALPEHLRLRLIDEYRADILELQTLLQRDLSHWLA